MRLFVALSICDEVRKGLASLLNDLRRADTMPRWVNPANLHITLKFIGHVRDEKLASMQLILAGIVVGQPLSLEFRGIGFFPNDRHPSVISVGVAAPSQLGELAAQIDEALSACDIARETRPFAPHLTLARFKEARTSETLRTQAAKYVHHSFGKQSFDQFHLMESKLKSTGADYSTLRSFRFSSQGLVH